MTDKPIHTYFVSDTTGNHPAFGGLVRATTATDAIEDAIQDYIELCRYEEQDINPDDIYCELVVTAAVTCESVSQMQPTCQPARAARETESYRLANLAVADAYNHGVADGHDGRWSLPSQWSTLERNAYSLGYSRGKRERAEQGLGGDV